MKDKEIIVQNLALELTRRCNLNCAHCARGDCQNKDMDDKTIERVFEDIDDIVCLQFTGGETSLAVPKVKKVLEEINKNKTKVHSAVIFTNAVDISDEYINCLKELQQYCEKSNKESINPIDVECGAKGIVPRKGHEYSMRVIISLDKYHLNAIDQLSSRKQVKRNVEKLVNNFAVEIDKLCSYTVFNDGRAKNLQYIYKEETPNTEYAALYWRMKEGYKDLCMIGPIVQITFDGKIGDCNKTYEDMDKIAIGNINEENIYSMFKKLQQDKKFKLTKTMQKLNQKFTAILNNYCATFEVFKRIRKFYKKHFISPDYSYFFDQTPGYKGLDETPSNVTIKMN